MMRGCIHKLVGMQGSEGIKVFIEMSLPNMFYRRENDTGKKLSLLNKRKNDTDKIHLEEYEYPVYDGIDMGKVSPSNIPIFSYRFQELVSPSDEEKAQKIITRENQLSSLLKDILDYL